MNENRTAFVTGGSKGIGRAVVETLAASLKHVAFTYNSDQAAAGTIAAAFDNVSFYQCDLRDRHQIAEVTQAVNDQLGRVDILVNNAACDQDAIFSKMTSQAWDDVIDVNLRALYDLTISFVGPMSDNNWGRIINLTSIAGFTGAFGKSNYSASKAGVIGFTKSLAIELASKNITVNAIAPGAIETDMLLRIPEKYRAQIMANIPAKRFGRSEEVADLIEFLVSDKASYITGQSIHINGGSY